MSTVTQSAPQITLHVAADEIESIVDQLGAVKAQIARLETREATLRQTLIDTGVNQADGRVFRATISVGSVSRVDWKAIAEHLRPSRQLVTAHSSETPRVTVKVVAR